MEHELPYLPNETIVRNNLAQDRISWLLYKAKAERAAGNDSNLNGTQQEFMKRLDRSLERLGIIMAMAEVEVVEVDE